MRMKWTGHILCISDKKTVKQVFRWEPSSRRSRGRPKKRWMDCVEDDLHRAGISRYGVTTGRQRVSLQVTAGDRSQWRELVAASTAGNSSVMTTDLTGRVTEVMVTTGAIRRAKLQSNCHHQQTNTQFFYRPDALPVAPATVLER